MEEMPADPLNEFDPDAAAIGDGVYGLPHSPDQAEVILLPVPWEATVSYRAGAADGPRAILAASRQVDLHDRETGDPWRRGIAMLPPSEEIEAWNTGARRLALPVIQAGGTPRPDRDSWDAAASASLPSPSAFPSGRTPPSRSAPDAPDALVLAEPTCTPELDLLRRAQAVDRLSSALAERVREQAAFWLDRAKLVGLVGGDHSTPLGLIVETAARHPGMGILQLDAHADLREAFEGFRYSHASIMGNVLRVGSNVGRLVQVGVRDLSAPEEEAIARSRGRVRTWFDADLKRRLQDGEPWSAIAREIVTALPAEVYLSFDIDGLDPSLCPHTGTPVPGGLSFAEAVSLLRHLAESGRRIVGFDLVEVAPGPAGDEWDANVGARLLYKMIGFALLTRPAPAPRRGSAPAPRAPGRP